MTQLFWQQPLESAFAALESRRTGLASDEATKRLQAFGPNTLREPVGQRLLAKITKRALNPLIAILLVATVISGASGDLGSFVIILSVMAISNTLDIVQEHHAEVAVETLRRSVAIKADVRCDGATVPLAVEELVPGDIVELRTGDLVPADGIVLEACNTEVNESLMTGKAASPIGSNPGLASAFVITSA